MNSVLCASSQSWVGGKMEKGINIIFSHKVKNLCLELFIHGFHGEAVRDTYREREEALLTENTGNGLHLSSVAMEMMLLAVNAPDLCFTCPLSWRQNIYHRKPRVLS